jgi:hypothetical protein
MGTTPLFIFRSDSHPRSSRPRGFTTGLWPHRCGAYGPLQCARNKMAALEDCAATLGQISGCNASNLVALQQFLKSLNSSCTLDDSFWDSASGLTLQRRKQCS